MGKVAATAPTALLDSKSSLAIASKIKPEEYPNADYVLVDDYTKTEVAADGNYVSINESYTKVLTEKGRRELLTRSDGFNIFYENFDALVMEIIRPGGQVIKLDPSKLVKVAVDTSSMGANIYDPNDKVVTLQFPDLQVGDTIHLCVRRVQTHARMAGEYFDMVGLESTCPILHLAVEYLTTTNKPLRTCAVLSPVEKTVSHTEERLGSRIRYIWEATHVPQAFPEPGMPPLSSVGQRLGVSTVNSWEEVSKWYWNLCKAHLEKTTPAMIAKARELASEGKTRDEKLRRIFKFVSQEIRYMGITTETDSPGFEPHDVSITFDNRYGVCRDKAALLVSMLRAADFDAYPVIIMAGPRKDPEIPNIYFNHAIVAVQNGDKTYTLMDSTDETTAELCPSYLNNCNFLPAKPGGETLLLSPVESPEKNMVKAQTELEIDPAGSINGTSVIHFEGINDNAYRSTFSQMKPDQIRQGIESALKNILPGAALTRFDLQPEAILDTTKPIVLTVGFSAPDALVSGSGRAMIRYPWFSQGMGVVNQVLARTLSLEKRRFPLKTGITCGASETITLHLPPDLGKALALPSPQTVDTPELLFRQNCSVKDGVFNAQCDLQLKQVEISPAGYLVLKKSMGELEVARRQVPIFACSPSDEIRPDVRVQLNRSEFTLASATEWTNVHTVKKEILTYAGKKGHSELRLGYNPIWEEVTLNYARVTQKDGTVKSIQPQEINIMDADWVTAAPRYPAGKTKVISLPGVEIGSVIEYQIQTRFWQQPYFSFTHAFVSSDPVDLEEILIQSPKDLPLNVEGFEVSEGQGGSHVYRASSTIAPTKQERNLPPYYLLGKWVSAFGIKSAGNVMDIMSKALSSKVETTSEIRAKAAALTKGMKNDYEKVIAIRDFVAKDIRYAGPSMFGLPLQCLTPASRTLADRYGNNADRAILARSLLKAAGVKSELLGVAGGEGRRLLPMRRLDLSWGEFNGLAIKLPTLSDSKTGGPAYLAEFNQYANLFATSLDGDLVFSLEKNHQDKPTTLGVGADPLLDMGIAEKVHVNGPYRTRVESSYVIDVDETGNAMVEVTKTSRGTGFAGFNRYHTEMRPEEKSRFHQQLITGLSANARAAGPMEVSTSYPGKLDYKATVDRFAISTEGYLYLNPPRETLLPFTAGTDTRTGPFYYASEYEGAITWTIRLPAGYHPAILPSAFDWKGPEQLGSYNVTSSSKRLPDGRLELTFRHEAHFEPEIVPASNYETLRELQRRLTHPSMWRILLEKDV